MLLEDRRCRPFRRLFAGFLFVLAQDGHYFVAQRLCRGNFILRCLQVSELARKVAALDLSSSEKDVIWRRFRIVDLCLNHNWKAEGYPSLGAFITALAVRNETSSRSIWRLLSAYRQRE